MVSPLSNSANPNPKLHVLVAEPVDNMREIIHRILMENLDINRVIDARNGEEVLEKLQSSPCDLLILDTLMRPLGGVELSRRIRNNEENIDPFIPIIIISDIPVMKEVVGARDAGATEYLVKPVSAKTLELRIETLMAHPRPFVKSESFFGPDRRRHLSEEEKNNERRHQEPDIIEPS